MNSEKKPLFELGPIVATPPCMIALKKAGQSIEHFVNKHVTGDWAELDDHDTQANEDAIWDETRIMSVYKTNCGDVIWVITEADRSSTCLLLPSCY